MLRNVALLQASVACFLHFLLLYLKRKAPLKCNGGHIQMEENMTFGEKLKSARKSAALTQEELAEKLMVSRQAITKWESDKGMPDIENLKSLSKLLGVSIDYLLENGEELDFSVMKEEINLDNYNYKRSFKGRWVKKAGKKDMIVREKFPNAEIRALLGKQKLTRGEKIIDTVVWLMLSAIGIPELINAVKNADKEFYLVDDCDKQFFVTVTDEFIESRHLKEKITQKKFEIGNFKFTLCNYLIP